MKADKKQSIFPHSLMIYLLENYSSPNRSVLLNNFLIKSQIGNTDKIIYIKAKDLLDRFEKDGYLFWTTSQLNTVTNDYISNGFLKDILLTVDNPLTDIYHVNAELTIKGIDYAIKLLRERDNFESTITTNKSIRLNVLATIIFSLIVTVLQLRTCAIEENKKDQEERRLNQDSLKQLEQSKHDSMLLYLLFQKQETIDSSKTLK